MNRYQATSGFELNDQKRVVRYVTRSCAAHWGGDTQSRRWTMATLLFAKRRVRERCISSAKPESSVRCAERIIDSNQSRPRTMPFHLRPLLPDQWVLTRR
jgi:hypothetical protein